MLGAIFCQSKDSYRPGGFLGCPAGQMPCTYGGNWKNLCSAMFECPVSLRETSVESNLRVLGTNLLQFSLRNRGSKSTASSKHKEHLLPSLPQPH